MERKAVIYDTQDFKDLELQPITVPSREALSDEEERQVRLLYDEELRLRFGEVQDDSRIAE